MLIVGGALSEIEGHMYYLYILRCRDNILYVGITNNLVKRVQYHNSGNVKFTKNRLPVQLVYSEEFEEKATTALREKQVKGWTRQKKENLISFGVPSLKLRK